MNLCMIMRILSYCIYSHECLCKTVMNPLKEFSVFSVVMLYWAMVQPIVVISVMGYKYMCVRDVNVRSIPLGADWY